MLMNTPWKDHEYVVEGAGQHRIVTEDEFNKLDACGLTYKCAACGPRISHLTMVRLNNNKSRAVTWPEVKAFLAINREIGHGHIA